jgi:hypothetical protein
LNLNACLGSELNSQDIVQEYFFVRFSSSIRETLAKKQEDLRGHEAEIANATKGMDFEACLQSAQRCLEKNQEYEKLFHHVLCNTIMSRHLFLVKSD